MKIFENGDFHCRRCGLVGGPRSKAGTTSKSGNASAGNAIDLLYTYAGLAFKDAVGLLAHGVTPDGEIELEIPEYNPAPAFAAALDTELYDAILEMASLEKAQEFFAVKGISPEAVAAAKVRFVDDPVSLTNKLLATFGVDRIVAAGLTDQEGKRMLLSKDYPVIEPQLNVTGNCTNLQFRASVQQREKVRAHDNKEPGSKYVPKFLSLRGATAAHRSGYGAHLLAGYPSGKAVWIGEGGQDFMAGLTMGLSMFCLPGTSTRPTDDIVKLLGRHKLVIAFDADKGGDEGRQGLVAFLAQFGICSVTEALAALIASPDISSGLKSLAKSPAQIKNWPGYLAAVAKQDENAAKVLRAAKWREDKGLTIEHRRPPEGMDLTDVLQDRLAKKARASS